MSNLKSIRLLTAAALLTSVSAASVLAQSQPAPAPTPPAATKPDPTPVPSPSPATKPMDPAARAPAATPPAADKSATAPKTNPLIGLAVFSSDGSRLGTVQSVSAEPDGKVKALHIKSGGFLGFGGKLVAIPEGKFTRAADNIQLGMTADEVSKLPEVKEQS